MLKTPLHGTRRVAWSTPFPLDRIRTAAHRADGKINDLLVTAVAGGLRSELERHGEVPDEVHIMVPFNLRPLDQPLPRDLGNDFALILLALPVGIGDRDEAPARREEAHGRDQGLARGPNLLRHPERDRHDPPRWRIASSASSPRRQARW